MPIDFIQHERVWLQGYPDFSEAWLQDRIAENPGILGLGTVDVLDRERRNPGAGRLDLLLVDPSGSPRYEVELMLGATDPDHIIRCLEYWDIERRRYPAYDHVAVLVAEDVTSRFINILSLFAGSVPLIALQLTALKVNNQIVLNFVKVLDQRSLRHDDQTTTTKGKSTSSRSAWVAYAGEDTIAMAEKILAMVNEHARVKRQLNYKQQFIGLTDGRRASNFIWFGPRTGYLKVGFSLDEPEKRSEQLAGTGLPVNVGPETVTVTIRPEEFASHEATIRDLVTQSVRWNEA